MDMTDESADAIREEESLEAMLAAQGEGSHDEYLQDFPGSASTAEVYGRWPREARGDRDRLPSYVYGRNSHGDMIHLGLRGDPESLEREQCWDEAASRSLKEDDEAARASKTRELALKRVEEEDSLLMTAEGGQDGKDNAEDEDLSDRGGNAHGMVDGSKASE
ncbi:hypothetical protein PRZ48_010242 [Zasmidium cellare]|uniref:Uncharacterized protein n=1 Tax=Zasmidium cellare TaxID=395010 RepID=A0ABR0E843_ZASCE|nr:hypothetical protein PRZ48_010242 [Zasmidium cellare]